MKKILTQKQSNSKTFGRTKDKRLRIGAHVSASGGAVKALERAHAIGANCLQLFGSSPMQWKTIDPGAEEAARFRALKKEFDINPVFLHAPYLINLASANKQLVAMSRSLLERHLKINNVLGANGVVFHIGSRGALTQVQGEEYAAEAITKVLMHVPEGIVLIENSAGAGNLIGDTLEEIGTIIKMIKNERVGFCYDTAHGFESGILTDFTAQSVKLFTRHIKEVIGLHQWQAIHANDSKTPAHSNKDRHENIGEGYMGMAAFETLLANEEFMKRPFVLEVPGYDGKGPDKKNIDILKKLI